MKGKFKWSLMLTVLLALSLVLSACGSKSKTSNSGSGNTQSNSSTKSSSSNSQLATDQTFSVDITSEPPSLNPQLATDSTSFAVLNQIFEGLTRIGPDGKPQNAIASNVKTSSDGKTYTFTLRDAKWSNGDPVTAQDFVYAWQYAIDPKNGSEYAYQLYDIKNAQKINNMKAPSAATVSSLGVTAVDSHTLKVELAHPVPYFLQLTAFPTFFPVDKKVALSNPKWADNAGTNYVTDGPFTLQTWDHKNKIVLKKSSSYWDAKTVKLQTINMAMINDANTELANFQQGKYDWAGAPTGNLPLPAIPSLKKSGQLQIKPIAGVYYYAINVNKKPFNNVNIRKALALAIDRNSIVTNITKSGQLPAEAFVPPSMFQSNKTGYFKDDNIAQAKKYLKKGLKELGYKSASDLPAITLSYNTSQSHQVIAQAIQDMWKKNLGINVKLQNSEWKVYLDTLSKGNFQVGRMGWLGDFNDAYNFLDIFYQKGGNNYTNWHDAQYSKLLDQSKTETDPAKRKATLKKAEKILMNQMPVIPIYFYTDAYVQKPYVKGVAIDGLGNVQYKWAYIAKH